MPYMPPLQQPGGVQPDFSGFDPATYMSPMDLYDSIFWGWSTSPSDISDPHIFPGQFGPDMDANLSVPQNHLIPSIPAWTL